MRKTGYFLGDPLAKRNIHNLVEAKWKILAPFKIYRFNKYGFKLHFHSWPDIIRATKIEWGWYGLGLN